MGVDLSSKTHSWLPGPSESHPSSIRLALMATALCPAAKPFSLAEQEYMATSEFPGRHGLQRASQPTPPSHFIDGYTEAQGEDVISLRLLCRLE